MKRQRLANSDWQLMKWQRLAISHWRLQKRPVANCQSPVAFVRRDERCR
ncbi:MAG: hypothetical protein RRB24_06255 [Armatimonadota bacterium]|nr:hypothetical protein [Armatimonadota bacterium]MDT7972415.1 hypothetical protein [Armatimonadota bacterium]